MPYLSASSTSSWRRPSDNVVPAGFWKLGSTYMNLGPERRGFSSRSVRRPFSSIGTSGCLRRSSSAAADRTAASMASATASQSSSAAFESSCGEEESEGDRGSGGLATAASILLHLLGPWPTSG